MRRCLLFTICSLLSFGAAHSAGTYYTGAYQSPQRRYTQPSYTPRPVASSTNQNRWNNSAVPAQRYNPQYSQPAAATGAQSSSNTGFYLSGGISHEFANWEFSMNQAGSILHYDNIAWNVFDLNAGYNFGLLKIEGGIKYGMQSGDSHMDDDDITNGGYWVGYVPAPYDQDIYGATLSTGTSSGGDMMNFNLGLALMDKMHVGNLKLTPSVGYRSLTYNLTTEKNNGMTLEYANFCLAFGDEIQCLPIVVEEGTDVGEFLQGSYIFSQPGTSHKYETSWAGPYLALDAEYEINQNNMVSARLEIGLPAYSSQGDQPYRHDWMHPKSVEDEGGFGDAWHIGLGADWKTALTDSVALSVGFTYNYYTLSGGNAKTYLNSGFYYDASYWAVVEAPVADGGYAGDEAAAIADGAVFTDKVNSVYNQAYVDLGCENWVCKADGEIESFYKSIGIRVGLAAKF
jgi:hypothetical protein